jgi:hypothetical protein
MLDIYELERKLMQSVINEIELNCQRPEYQAGCIIHEQQKVCWIKNRNVHIALVRHVQRRQKDEFIQSKHILFFGSATSRHRRQLFPEIAKQIQSNGHQYLFSDDMTDNPKFMENNPS